MILQNDFKSQKRGHVFSFLSKVEQFSNNLNSHAQWEDAKYSYVLTFARSNVSAHLTPLNLNINLLKELHHLF